ncbi:lrr and pyd domains-containing protein 3-like protein, partial [Lasius niger]
NVMQSVQGSYVADLSTHYKVLLLYTDIIEPQIVGDVTAPLLRIVSVSGQDGELVSAQYERPHYLPVSRKTIDTIEMNIRLHTGELVPFERGRSYVKLHFRQKFLS